MKIYEHHDHGLRVRQSADEAIAWRHRNLVDAGFAEGVASTVAIDPCIDMHALLQLTDRGCPPELAVKILAPLREEVGS